MASYSPVQGVGIAFSRSWKRHQGGRQRGGRRPAGGGPISRRSRSGLYCRSWLCSSRNRMVGRGMVEALEVWLGRAGGEGAPPDAA